MTSLGFENYAEALKIYLAKYREVGCRVHPSTIPRPLLRYSSLFEFCRRINVSSRLNLREATIRTRFDRAAATDQPPPNLKWDPPVWELQTLAWSVVESLVAFQGSWHSQVGIQVSRKARPTICLPLNLNIQIKIPILTPMSTHQEVDTTAQRTNRIKTTLDGWIYPERPSLYSIFPLVYIYWADLFARLVLICHHLRALWVNRAFITLPVPSLICIPAPKAFRKFSARWRLFHGEGVDL